MRINLFMALIMNLLKDHGRCGVVLPDGFMFGDGVKATIKKSCSKNSFMVSGVFGMSFIHRKRTASFYP